MQISWILIIFLIAVVCWLIYRRIIPFTPVFTGGSQNISQKLVLSVQEPWLEQIRIGKKKVEGRSGSANKFLQWIGKEATFVSKSQSVRVKVINVRHYNSLYDYLDKEGWEMVAPHLTSYNETIDEYHKFYSDKKIQSVGGMNAIEIELI